MATIKVTKASSVQSIKRQFTKDFNCNLRIYNGKKFADEKMLISDLSKTENSTGELELGARSRVENVEKYFKDTFGITAQISNADDTKLAGNEMTLTQAGNL
jgi:hypothetical protein